MSLRLLLCSSLIALGLVVARPARADPANDFLVGAAVGAGVGLVAGLVYWAIVGSDEDDDGAEAASAAESGAQRSASVPAFADVAAARRLGSPLRGATASPVRSPSLRGLDLTLRF